VPRQCLGLILTRKFGMTYQSVGNLLNRDHSNIVYANKKAQTQIEIGEREYTTAMINWRIIFDENEIDINSEIDQKGRLKTRINNLLSDAVLDGIITLDERDNMLITMLKTTPRRAQITEENELY